MRNPRKRRKSPKQPNRAPGVHLDEPQPFSEHLRELRSRILLTLAFLMVGTLVGYAIHDTVLTILIQPLHRPLFYSSPAGGFDFTVRISVLFGFIVSIPVLVYQALRFTAPAFPEQSPKKLAVVLLSSCVLLILGVCFAYFISLPAALYFLSGFTTTSIQALISTSEYFSFVTWYLLGFGLLFQFPLVVLIINSLHQIPTKNLMHYQQWVILVSFIVAAFLTPTPDPLNQTLMALPVIVLYQVTVLLLWLINRKRRSPVLIAD